MAPPNLPSDWFGVLRVAESLLVRCRRTTASLAKPFLLCLKILKEHLDADSFRKVRSTAHYHAKKGYEVCGAIIRKEDGILTLRPLKNLATKPATWEIEIEWLRDLHRELKGTCLSLVGTYHSHVGGFAYPGEKDLEYYPSAFLMMIYDTQDRRVGMWKPLIRKNRGKLRAVAVTCVSPKWNDETAISYATFLSDHFRNKAKRNS